MDHFLVISSPEHIFFVKRMPGIRNSHARISLPPPNKKTIFCEGGLHGLVVKADSTHTAVRFIVLARCHVFLTHMGILKLFIGSCPQIHERTPFHPIINDHFLIHTLVVRMFYEQSAPATHMPGVH